MEKYFLEDKEKEKLLAFCGYGDYKSAKIAFLGNEEGLGGYPLKYGIKARCAAFGNNPETYTEREAGWQGGYYEDPEFADMRFKEEMQRLMGTTRSEGQLNSPMLQYQARLMLYIQHGCSGDWFSIRAQNPSNFTTISNYYRGIGDHKLYRETTDLKSALIDLRPFPRRDEGNTGNSWPYANIDESQYNRAFSFKQNARMEPEYAQLQEKRAQYLKRTIEAAQFPIIIGIGDKAAKRNFFETYFNAEFNEEHHLTKNKVEAFVSRPVGNWGMRIVLSDFFMGGHGIGLQGLEKLATEIIGPLLKA